MNKVVLLKQASSASLAVGPCKLLVSENALVFNGRQVRLEPRVVQVLQVLSGSLNEVVTRERLIAEVWEGRPITDDAITRCISRLRKAFAQDLAAPLRIDTVAKSGYRLIIDPVADVPISTTELRPTLVGALVILICLAMVIFWPDGGDPHYQRESLLVSEQWERYPDFSPDGSLFTYSKGRSGVGLAVMLRQYGGEGVQQLTSGEFYDHQPTFSPDGQAIAFARLDQHSCRVFLTPVIGGNEKRLGKCGRRGVKDLAWSPDGQSLLMVTHEQYLQPGRLLMLSLNTNRIVDITPEHGEGVDDLAVSTNGKIAISVHFDLGVEDIFIGKLEDIKSWQRLSYDQIKVHGLAWSPRNKQLLFSSNRGGTFQLWRWGFGDESPRVIPQALNGVGAIAVHPRGHLLVERWHEESAVLSGSLNATGEPRELIAAKGVNWDAQSHPRNGPTVFVSDRTGSAELWLRDVDIETRLTRFGGPWVMAPRWSPDGKSIAFMLPRGHTFASQIYDIERREMLGDLTEENAFAPHWSKDGKSLYFGSQSNGEWQVWRKDLATGERMLMTIHGGKVAQVMPDRRKLLVSKANRSGLWQVDLQNPNDEIRLIDNLAPVDWNNWKVTEEAVFYVQRREGSSPILRHYRLANGEDTSVRELPGFLYFSGIDIQQDRFIYAATTREDADIDVLTLQDD